MKYLSLLILAVLLSCTTVKRYKSIVKTDTDTGNIVSINLFGTKIDAAKEEDHSKSLWDLQAEGEAELIKELAKRNSEDEKFNAALNTRYLKAKEKTETDYTSKDLKLIFSISKKRDYLDLGGLYPKFTLGDRIEYIQFKIEIPESLKLNFIKWNKFTTEYATIDVADVSFNQSLEITPSFGISGSSGSENTVDNLKTTSSGSLTPSLSAKGTTGKTETQKVRYRYVSLNGKINDKQISIEQEGVREIDLSGNVIADINLKFDEDLEILTTVEGYKASSGAYNLPDKLKVALLTAKVPVVEGLPDSIKATLTWEYAYRHIIKGEKTFYEWDDKVEYLKGNSSSTITLFKKNDYLPSFYNIAQIGEDTLTSDERTRIMIEDVNSNSVTEMVFPSLAAAQEFWNWLAKYDPAQADLNKPIVFGSYKLLYREKGKDTDFTKQIFNANGGNLQVLTYYR